MLDTVFNSLAWRLGERYLIDSVSDYKNIISTNSDEQARKQVVNHSSLSTESKHQRATCRICKSDANDSTESRHHSTVYWTARAEHADDVEAYHANRYRDKRQIPLDIVVVCVLQSVQGAQFDPDVCRLFIER